MNLKLPIISKNRIAKDVWEICFDLLGKDFKFKAGQYIKVTLPEVDLYHPKGNLREFSIISSPNSKNILVITFRESDSDFKQALLAHSIGDQIKISGPFGDLVLPKDQEKSLVMLAGGMGITPFLSMLLYISEQKLNTKILLIYVNSKPETEVFLKMFKAIKFKNNQFNLIHSPNRLAKKSLKSYLDSFDPQATFMIAGPPRMVSDTRLNLLDLGVKNNQIVREDFTGY